MKLSKRLVLAFTVAAVAASLTAPPVASAATEFGDTCSADTGGAGSYTLTTLSAPAGPLLAAPVSGVITKAKFRSEIPLPFSVPFTFKVIRPAGVNTFTTVNQAPISVTAGLTVADVRLPVQAGDHLAVHGEPFTYEGSSVPGFILYCTSSKAKGDLGAIASDVPPGTTATYPKVTEGRMPLAAIIEPDADNDGFGDETQDLCPQSAAFQIACPLAALEAIALKPRKRFVKVLVSASAAASVSVVGTVNLGKGAKATLKAGPKALAAGTIGRFTLRFPASLKERLAELEAKQKLTLKITASSTNVAGQVSTDKTKVKLKGQR